MISRREPAHSVTMCVAFYSKSDPYLMRVQKPISKIVLLICGRLKKRELHVRK
jgi:hypothetical protein